MIISSSLLYLIEPEKDSLEMLLDFNLFYKIALGLEMWYMAAKKKKKN